MAGSIGKKFAINSFGESHSKSIGVTVNGCPINLKISEKDIQKDLDRRRPGQSNLVSPRLEKDKVKIQTGVIDGKTNGDTITMIIENKDVKSDNYARIKYRPRPGHADYPAWIKYGDSFDYRGGGIFSGRITATYVMAGAIAKKLLKEQLDVEVFAHTLQVGKVKVEKKVTAEMVKQNAEKNPVRCADSETAKLMIDEIEKAKSQSKSVYSIVEGIALNVPVGLGSYTFDSFKGDLARYLMLIPGVKGLSFGEYANIWFKKEILPDKYKLKNGRIIAEKNIDGGIVGGLTDGMPIRCQVLFKAPFPGSREYETVDIKTMEEVKVKRVGEERLSDSRDDPCLAPRAVPVVEAMMANCIVDHALKVGKIKTVLEII